MTGKNTSTNSTIKLALDTIAKQKQGIIFVNTKRSAEKCAEDISTKIKTKNIIYDELAQQALHALSSPTKQCTRLAKILKKGIAFHHAGLNAKQRELIEENFRKGVIKIICSTPTLAIGLDLPAYRVIIRDLKRFGPRGLDFIPVLEYHQMAGRAGRPKYDTEGEAICLSNNEDEKELIIDKYINGEPEDIFSKLAVEPVLRTYVLSLVASGVVRSKTRLLDFFSKTFWAHHYKELDELNLIIEKILTFLIEWGFIENSSDSGSVSKTDSNSIYFVSASEIKKDDLNATRLGKRVAQLYIDPLTANFFLKSVERKSKVIIRDISFLQLVSHTLEMRPLLRTRTKEFEEIESNLVEMGPYLLEPEPSMYNYDYQEFIDSFKTSLFIYEWIEESSEDYLLEKYGIRPGEIRVKLDNAEWLLYSLHELLTVTGQKDILSDINRVRLRIKHGAKEELLPLLKLKNIGRVRARKLFRNGIKDLGAVKKTDVSKLTYLLGKGIAKSIVEQTGITEKKKRRQGTLMDY